MGRYGKSSDEAMRQERVGGSEFWNPSDGDSRVRIMPPATEEAENFWFKTGTHYGVGPDERVVPCPTESGVSEKCYLCRLVKRLGKGDEDEQDEAKRMAARPRYLVSIVDYAEPEAGIRVWQCPVTVMRLLRKFRLNEDEYGDMTDLEDGYDILITKTGTGINTKYDATPARKNTKFPTKDLLNHKADAVAELYQALKDEELELPNLEEVQNFVDDEEMESIYRGTSDSGRTRTESSSDDDDDDDQPDEKSDEKPEPRRSRRSARSSRDEEPEEGDDDQNDDPDDDDDKNDEEPEEKPRSRRSSRRSSKDEESDDEEPDDEPEEEEEPEEEAPKKKRGSKSSKSSKSDEGRSRIRGRVRDLDNE